MRRRGPIVVAASLAIGLAVVSTPAAYAALVEVKTGNFYYDDQSVGDGKVEATVGDQLRFVIQDGGPGTPHTVEVDELDIHSGSLASGTTFTTPPLGRAGTFRLYCKPHDRRGHVATLLVYNADGSVPTATTTGAPTTTAAPVPQPQPTAAPNPTTAPQQASSPPTTTAANAAPGSAAAATTTAPAAISPATTAAPAGDLAAPPSSDGATTEIVPAGAGEATVEELADVPVQPGSLEAALGRRPAPRGPWTRSVRMALAALAPMLLLAGFAISKARSDGDAEDP